VFWVKTGRYANYRAGKLPGEGSNVMNNEAVDNDNDNDNNAESFDEELLIEEGADDTDISGQFPADGYRGVVDRSVTAQGEASDDTVEERVSQENSDPVADELDRNARLAQLEDEAFAGTERNDQTAPLDAQLADLDDNLIDRQ
jgi:hypothetical protein